MVNEKRRVVLICGDAAAGPDFDLVLHNAGFSVDRADSGRLGVQQVERAETDIVLVFPGLPDIDMNETIQRIRPITKAHIIAMLPSDDEIEVVLALEAGADQYMAGTGRMRELRARINAIMRQRERMRQLLNGIDPGGGEELRHRDLILNTSTWDVTIDGTSIPVTATEFSLLHMLLMNPGRVRSKQEMVRHLNGYENGGDSYISSADQRSIEVHIANLRRKLGDSAREPKWIETVRGVGYRMITEQKLAV